MGKLKLIEDKKMMDMVLDIGEVRDFFKSKYGESGYKKIVEDKNLVKTVSVIIEAQDFLKSQYGEKDYQKLMDKLNAKNLSVDVLTHMYKDESLDSVIRVAAIASMGY